MHKWHDGTSNCLESFSILPSPLTTLNQYPPPPDNSESILPSPLTTLNQYSPPPWQLWINTPLPPDNSESILTSPLTTLNQYSPPHWQLWTLPSPLTTLKFWTLRYHSWFTCILYSAGRQQGFSRPNWTGCTTHNERDHGVTVRSVQLEKHHLNISSMHIAIHWSTDSVNHYSVNYHM